MHLIDTAIIVIYIVGMIIIGLYLQKRASAGIDSYFLGDRTIPWWALGASGMASNLDVAGTMINTAFIYTMGISGFFIEFRGGVCLILAFLIVYMGKWTRRSKVMTVAEWMHFRFGKDREGDVARLLGAISSIIVTIAMITYFAVGTGKFFGTFFELPHLGTVSDPLLSEEIVKIDQSLTGVLASQTQINQQANNFEKIKSINNTAANSIINLIQNWQQVKQDPTSITKLDFFSDQVASAKTQLRSLIRCLNDNQQSLTMENYQSLLNDSQKVLGELDNLALQFAQSTRYTIILDNSFIASILIIILAMIYTVTSGLYGVVWTDVFQGVLIFATIAVVSVMAFQKELPAVFNISIPMRDGTFMALETTREKWTEILHSSQFSFAADSEYSIYNLFGIAVLFYLIKVIIEGAGGTTNYMAQRYFAAKDDREAGLLSIFWTFLLSFRWPFIAAMAILGIYLGVEQGMVIDPESVLPIVINHMVPVGLKGLLVAGLMAAAMSTFDSTVNAGAAYWTKDIYQAYLKPKASEKQLIFHSRLASILIVLIGLAFQFAVRNINEIWGWITMSIGAGMIVPMLIRWYWWRMNGYGFAIGTAVGMLAAVFQKLVFPNVPEYVAFSFSAGISLLGTIIGTYITGPTDYKVLKNFYLTTRPFGFWKPVRASVSKETLDAIDLENRRDVRALFIALPWQVVLFMSWMTIIMKRWDQFILLFVALVILSVGLYFFWYRYLSYEVKVDVEDI
jgi:Na+/proline symporter